MLSIPPPARVKPHGDVATRLRNLFQVAFGRPTTTCDLSRQWSSGKFSRRTGYKDLFDSERREQVRDAVFNVAKRNLFYSFTV